jgi:hypothetical protein
VRILNVALGGSGNEKVKSDIKSDTEDILGLCVDVFVGCSQIDIMRNCFCEMFSIKTKQHNGTVENELNETCIANEILMLIDQHGEYAANGIAALMNASLEPTNAVRDAIFNSNGLKIALSSIDLSDEERNTSVGVLLSRKIGLLSRLATLSSVQQFILQEKDLCTYRMICRRLSFDIRRVQNDGEQWKIVEHGHFVRVLASLSNPSEACKRVGMEENILFSLLQVFPTPREYGGEITPLSVTLMPHEPINAVSLGNAARCLMSYADDIESHAIVLFKQDKLLAVEKMVCAMASCTDTRVRKNIAILLAKGCRIQGVREKVTLYRGMEMMIELQNKF